MTARLTRPEYRIHDLIEGRDDQDLIDTLLACADISQTMASS